MDNLVVDSTEVYGTTIVDAAKNAVAKASETNDKDDLVKAVQLAKQANDFLKIQADFQKSDISNETENRKITEQFEFEREKLEHQKASAMTELALEREKLEQQKASAMSELAFEKEKLEQQKVSSMEEIKVEKEKLEQQKDEAKKQRRHDYAKLGLFAIGNLGFAAFENGHIIKSTAVRLWQQHAMPIFERLTNRK